MKEKSIWKELLNRAGWLLIFFLATILYQIPIGVTAILTLNQYGVASLVVLSVLSAASSPCPDLNLIHYNMLPNS